MGERSRSRGHGRGSGCARGGGPGPASRRGIPRWAGGARASGQAQGRRNPEACSVGYYSQRWA